MIKMLKTARSEKHAVILLRDYLIAKRWWISKLHGDVCQRGLPDLLVCRQHDGKLMLFELKNLKQRESYAEINLIESLAGTQIGNILLLAKLKAPIWIIGLCPKGWLAITPPFQSSRIIEPRSIDELYEILNK